MSELVPAINTSVLILITYGQPKSLLKENNISNFKDIKNDDVTTSHGIIF